MTRRARRLRLLPALLLAANLRADSPLIVIVNPTCGINTMTKEQVVDIFMGRQKHLPCGLVALPVEQVEPSASRIRYYQALVNLPLPQVRACWARLYFSGQAQPPRQTASDEETLQVVGANKGAIGFIEAGHLDSRVRGVLQLEP